MIVYKINVLAELKEAGYSQRRLLDEKILSSKTLTDIRNGRMIGIHVLDKLCELLDMQPGNIIKYKQDND